MSKKNVATQERTYTTAMKYVCPVRGEVSQIVTVRVYAMVEQEDTFFEDEEVKLLMRQEGFSSVEDDLP